MNIAIVGSNRGIGLALTKELVSQGHNVFAFCRKSSSELAALNPSKIIENFEVTDLENMENHLKDSGISEVDQLLHVSGIMKSSTLENFDVQAIEEQIKVNSIAPILSVKAFLPYMSPLAKIGLVTSRMGSIEDNDSGGAYGYRMSKTALNCAGKSLSLDLKDQGKAVFLLHPGWVRTDMTQGSGLIDANESAQGLIEIMNSKTMEDTGSFWHVNGERLPW